MATFPGVLVNRQISSVWIRRSGTESRLLDDSIVGHVLARNATIYATTAVRPVGVDGGGGGSDDGHPSSKWKDLSKRHHSPNPPRLPFHVYNHRPTPEARRRAQEAIMEVYDTNTA
ncbi:hypothetical protein EDD21DRAFT_415184 [Dissophora ornata]|nr:hypothetical protein EDD21DRAFT_415184 [Dissophora ornata]